MTLSSAAMPRWALQLAELGLTSHPESEALAASRAHALSTLRLQSAQTNPFRFIVYSELAGQGIAPVQKVAPQSPLATAAQP
jgi:hypothetical protein